MFRKLPFLLSVPPPCANGLGGIAEYRLHAASNALMHIDITFSHYFIPQAPRNFTWALLPPPPPPPPWPQTASRTTRPPSASSTRLTGGRWRGGTTTTSSTSTNITTGG